MTIDLHKQERTVTDTPLAAGRYWVGDPCYAFTSERAQDHAEWMAWLDDAWKETDPNQLTILDGSARGGGRIAASRTACGDGVYYDQDGNEYPVDAGLLGAVHEKHWVVGSAPRGMHLIDFPEPFHVSYSNGTVTIGHVEIETGDEPDWDDEDDDEDDGWAY